MPGYARAQTNVFVSLNQQLIKLTKHSRRAADSYSIYVYIYQYIAVLNVL